jgi:hypothetical protein
MKLLGEVSEGEHGWKRVGGRDVFGPLPLATSRTMQTAEERAAEALLEKARRKPWAPIDPWRER